MFKLFRSRKTIEGVNDDIDNKISTDVLPSNFVPNRILTQKEILESIEEKIDIIQSKIDAILLK
jgi:hypothetical protein